MTFARKRVGESYRGNCWFLVLKLWLKGRLLGLLIQKRSKRLPHAMAYTHRENVVHFKADGKEPLFPFWIRGHVEVIRGSVWKRR